jgi:hypothetical protein
VKLNAQYAFQRRADSPLCFLSEIIPRIFDAHIADRRAQNIGGKSRGEFRHSLVACDAAQHTAGGAS